MKKLLQLCILGFLFAVPSGLLAQSTVSAEDKPVYGVEFMPQFPGGEEALLKFIKENLHYPKVAAEVGIEGRVTVRFVVSRTGEVTDVTVIRGLDPSCDNEAVRVVKMMPTWLPGRQNGRNVPVYYTLPIVYKLQKGNTEDKSPLLVVDGRPLPYTMLRDTNQLKPSDIKNIQVLKDSTAMAVWGVRGKNGVIVVETISGAAKRDSALNIPDKDGVFSAAEIMPKFPDGESALINFISTNLRYPTEANSKGIEGLSVIRFVIDRSGAVVNPTVIRSLSAECDAESIRMLRLMPNWKPGTTKGNPVDVYYTLPVRFKISNNIPIGGIKDSSQQLEKPIYEVNVMPQFPGGEAALLGFIRNNLHYPSADAVRGIQGRVVIRFVISKSGQVTDVNVIRGLSKACDEEAVRVVKLMPSWIPGKQNGKIVPVYYTLPVVYKLQK